MDNDSLPIIPALTVPIVDIQHACTATLPVSDATLIQWVQQTLPKTQQHVELTLRFVDCDEMITLNSTYRKQHKPTNVLAFPTSLPDLVVLDYPFLGDVIICPTVLEEEIVTQQLPRIAHWAHIVIHGLLHLLGHDHQGIQDTKRMQTLEISTLSALGLPNPYSSPEDRLLE